MNNNPSHNDSGSVRGDSPSDNLQLLKTTIDSSLDMIQVFEAVRNDGGTIIDFVWVLNNEASARIYGDVIGKSLLALQPGVVEEGIFDAFKQVVETGVPQQYEKHYVHEQFDGWFYQSAVKLNDGVATTTANITEQKNAAAEILRLKDEIAQKATDKYKALFDSVDEGFAIQEVMTDEAGNVTDVIYREVNRAFEQHTGMKDALGKRVSEFVPHIEQAFLDALTQVYQTGKPLRGENYTADLSRWFTYHYSRIGGSGSPLIAVVFNNITERKQRERELTRYNELLQATFDNSLQIIQLFKAVRDEQTKEIVDFEWLMTNKCWNDLYGAMKRKRLLTQNPAVIETGLFDDFKRVTDTGISITQEHYYRHEQFDGWFLQTVAKVEDGFLLSTLDITDRKRREANASFLNEISQDLAHLTNIDETMKLLGEKMAAYFNLAAVAFAEISKDEMGIIDYAWQGSNMPSFVGTYAMKDFVSPEVLEYCRTGRDVVIRDVFADPRTDGEQYKALNIGSFLSIPLLRSGEWRFLLVIYHSEPYDWNDDEIALTREFANRVWTRLERARAEEALHQTQEAYRIQLEREVRNRTLELVASRDELEREQHFLEQVTDKAPLLIYVYDLEEERFTYINKRVEELIGKSEEYVYAMGPHLFQAILHPEDLSRYTAYMNGLKNLSGDQITENDFRVWNGSQFRWFRSRDSVFQEEKKHVLQVIGIAEDVTYEKMLEERLQNKGPVGLN